MPSRCFGCLRSLRISRSVRGARTRIGSLTDAAGCGNIPIKKEMPVVLELRRVSKRFASQLAVNDVSLQVKEGAFYALLGPSGCGKTTTLRLVAGFEEATSGEICLGDQRINHLRPYERPVSTVFQNYALFPHLPPVRTWSSGFDRERASRESDDRSRPWIRSRWCI